jgi:hypothetical protein
VFSSTFDIPFRDDLVQAWFAVRCHRRPGGNQQGYLIIDNPGDVLGDK